MNKLDIYEQNIKVFIKLFLKCYLKAKKIYIYYIFEIYNWLLNHI